VGLGSVFALEAFPVDDVRGVGECHEIRPSEQTYDHGIVVEMALDRMAERSRILKITLANSSSWPNQSDTVSTFRA
jgi:hypothetical protein